MQMLCYCVGLIGIKYTTDAPHRQRENGHGRISGNKQLMIMSTDWIKAIWRTVKLKVYPAYMYNTIIKAHEHIHIHTHRH